MRDMNWNAMYTLWLVARCGSFAEAARRMPGTTAQALHKRVRQLEWEAGLNLKLLRSRGVKGVELTEAGRRLLEMVDPVFTSLPMLAADLRKEDSGPLSLATTGFAAYNFLPRILEEFRGRFPEVTVSVRVRSESDVIAMAETGQVDLGIGALSGRLDRLAVAARAPLTIQLVAPSRLRWGSARPGWAEVLRRPLVLHERVSVLRIALEEVLSRRNMMAQLKIAAEVTTPELLLEMVRAGFGVGIIPLGPRLAESLDGLSIQPLPEGLARIDLGVFHKPKRYVPGYMKAFLETAASVIRT